MESMMTTASQTNAPSHHAAIHTERDAYNPARSPAWAVADAVHDLAVELVLGGIVTRYCDCTTAWTAGPHTPAVPSPYPYEVIVHGTCSCGAARGMDGDSLTHLDAFDAAAHLATSARDTAATLRARIEQNTCYDLLARVAELGTDPSRAEIAALRHFAAELTAALDRLGDVE